MSGSFPFEDGGLGPNEPLVLVEIAENGQVSIDGHAFDGPAGRSLPQFTGELIGIAEKFGSDAPVRLRSSPDSGPERIVDVLNACAAAHLKNVTFAEVTRY